MLISSDFSVSSQNTPLLNLWSLPDLRKSAFLTTNYKDILVIIVCTPPTKAFHLQIISEDTLIMGILLFQLKIQFCGMKFLLTRRRDSSTENHKATSIPVYLIHPSSSLPQNILVYLWSTLD